MTPQELATALTGNDFTEAEALTNADDAKGSLISLTVRPKHSSRTFTALVRVESIKEV